MQLKIVEILQNPNIFCEHNAVMFNFTAGGTYNYHCTLKGLIFW
jgi:hypothetical protein